MLRNYWIKRQDQEKFSGKFQTRYTLGSTLDDKLDIAVVFGLNKADESTVISDRGTRIESIFTL